MWNKSFFVLCLLVAVFSALLVQLSDQESRLIFYPAPMNWSDAQRHCRKYHQDLATLTNNNDVIRASKLCGEKSICWIGLFRAVHNENVWNWSGGKKSSFTKWEDGEPNSNSKEKEDCVFIKNGFWFDAPCHWKHAFLCHENELILVKENKTWEDALEHCRNLGMDPNTEESSSSYWYDLASISFAYFNTWRMIKEAQTEEVWIGLTFLAGHWVWVGEPAQLPIIFPWLHLNGMYGKLPDCPQPGMHCGAMSKDWRQLKLINCEERRNFFCLKRN